MKTKLNKKPNQCLFHSCKHTACRRGLCERDYATASYLVKSGRTTWERLEKNHKALPLAPRRKMTKVQWFLEGKA